MTIATRAKKWRLNLDVTLSRPMKRREAILFAERVFVKGSTAGAAPIVKLRLSEPRRKPE